MLPKKGKGQFVFCPTGATSGPIVADAADAANTDDSSYGTSPAALPSGNSFLNLEQLTAAANEITRASQQQQQTPSGTHDPNIMPSSAPSSFFSPSAVSTPTTTSTSALTSISRAKRKVPPSAPESAAGVPKRSRPLSVVAQAQQAGGVAMQEIAIVVKDISHSIAPPPPPLDPICAAIDILKQCHELTPIQRLDIGDYLALEKNRNQAILFYKLDEEDRKAWLVRRLSEIAANQRYAMW